MATPVFCLTCNRSGYLPSDDPGFCPVCSSAVVEAEPVLASARASVPGDGPPATSD